MVLIYGVLSDQEKRGSVVTDLHDTRGSGLRQRRRPLGFGRAHTLGTHINGYLKSINQRGGVDVCFG